MPARCSFSCYGRGVRASGRSIGASPHSEAETRRLSMSPLYVDGLAQIGAVLPARCCHDMTYRAAGGSAESIGGASREAPVRSSEQVACCRSKGGNLQRS